MRVGALDTNRWSPMSNRTPLHDVSNDWLRPSITVETIATPLSALAFWAAIAIPVMYVPVLATGINGATELGLFFGLFGVHLLALFGGRSYQRD